MTYDFTLRVHGEGEIIETFVVAVATSAIREALEELCQNMTITISTPTMSAS